MNLEKKFFIKSVVLLILKTFFLSWIIILSSVLIYGTYRYGYLKGYVSARKETEDYLSKVITDKDATSYEIQEGLPLPTIAPSPSLRKVAQAVNWGGPELWEAVNSKRVEYGVNPLKKSDELCTIASIRLNELLDLGGLDGHEGFGNMAERRPDLKWIFEKFSTLAEFLAYGGLTPNETVDLWDNTLGHKKLLDGGEFVWGCIYAQNTFAVAIAAY